MRRKKVFVAASITGGRETLPFVQIAIRSLQDRGYEVLSEHNGGDDPV